MRKKKGRERDSITQIAVLQSRPRVSELLTCYAALCKAVCYIEGFGAEFIHHQTRTLYTRVQRTRSLPRFLGITLPATRPAVLRGNQIPRAVVDACIQAHVQDLP